MVRCVQVLCEEMAGAFEGRAMTCPPWRQARAMLSKWLPAKVRKFPVPSFPPSPVTQPCCTTSSTIIHSQVQPFVPRMQSPAHALFRSHSAMAGNMRVVG